MTEMQNSNPSLNRAQLIGLVVGAGCAVVALIGAFSTELRENFFSSYLFSYLFILGIALGSMVIVMMHHMTGGGWGYCVRRIAEASAMTMPLLTVLFIPIALNTHYLFPWANPDVTAGDKVLEFQGRVWMNQQMWCIRAVIYFAIWNIMAFYMWFGAGRHDRTGNPWVVLRLKQVSAIGTFIYVITMSFAAVDWIMAREAHWYSSIIGLVVCVSQTLSALVLCIVVLRFASKTEPLHSYATPPRLNDLGNLFLTFTILWAYMNFAQLLIIWMGNTAVDSPWYVRRGLGGDPGSPHAWKWLALLLLLAHFFIPFFILLGRTNKRRIEPLSLLAAMMVLMRAIDCFWWAGPTSLLDRGHEGPYLVARSVHWLDIVTPIGLFGIWFAVMVVILKLRPLLARMEDGPEVEPGAHHAHATA